MRMHLYLVLNSTRIFTAASRPQAKSACDHLTRAEMFGRPISVRPSKHRDISMPRGLAGSADDVAAAALSVDFTDQPVHRFRNAVAAAHNAKNVCAPGPVLHLSSLPESATDQSIRELFAQYGQVCV